MTFKLFITIGTFIALLMPLGAQALIINSITGGSYTVQQMTAPHTTGPFLEVVAPSITNAQNVLNGLVLGDVKLGTHLETTLRTTMTVTFTGGSEASFSNLLKTDWTDDGNALVHNYITAAGNSVLMTLTQAQLDDATTHFLDIPLPGNIYAWQLASDPTSAAIKLVNGHIIVEQDGLFNPANYLNVLFSGTGAPPAPANSQASEVVKVAYNGSTQYLYSFLATPTGYSAPDTVSYTGRYTAQTVPEPAMLLLLGVGFMGLGYLRRYNKRA